MLAFVAEPVVGATMGAVPAVPGYLSRIRELCSQYGVLLILDEVICGMGRTGHLFACAEDGVAPDMVTIAKGLGAGYQPIRWCYHALAEAEVAVQHILYDAVQVAALAVELAAGTIPGHDLQVLYVLGRYTVGKQSDPAMLTHFLGAAQSARLSPDWAICAFGAGETVCLCDGWAQGGKVRVGFENNLWMSDGTLAHDNAARVREIVLEYSAHGTDSDMASAAETQ